MENKYFCEHKCRTAWITTSIAEWWNTGSTHETQTSVQLQPHNDFQQPMTADFLHIHKYTWHWASSSTALSRRAPVERRGEEGNQNNGLVLIHIRWLSVTCGVQPKAKGHCDSAALYNVTLGLANSQAISLAARGPQGSQESRLVSAGCNKPFGEGRGEGCISQEEKHGRTFTFK